MTPSPKHVVFRPAPRFAFSHPAHFIAMGFGSGLAPFAPGTVGTLVALPLWWVLAPGYGAMAVLLLCVPLFAVGVWACDITGRHLGIGDHGSMVWDEVVAFLAILAVIPDDWRWQTAAFFLFRAFDVVKPPPIRNLERRIKGGFGVMFDDLLAAGYTLLVLAIAQRILQAS